MVVIVKERRCYAHDDSLVEGFEFVVEVGLNLMREPELETKHRGIVCNLWNCHCEQFASMAEALSAFDKKCEALECEGFYEVEEPEIEEQED